ncbi:hypothetical protein AMATHDRAFT_2808 [Amanita thiersii Skay4041]|uniref:Uncharacterized protein n=1 Tax=Amanita thiersii Skay4041 TaxID=703135 RepID=A0A2A9NVA8_9AGAR|nr:hypothetical protein AMATHDRAFT_2808 [Amanita thiersii Skay4041]
MSGSHYLGALKSLLTTMTTLGIPSFYASRWNRFSLMNQTTQGLASVLHADDGHLLGSFGCYIVNDFNSVDHLFLAIFIGSASTMRTTMQEGSLSGIFGIYVQHQPYGAFGKWAFIALIASIISAIADPSILQNNFSNQPLVSPRSLPAPDTTWTSVTALRILLTAMTCSALLALTLTILHLRRISHLQPV